MPRAYPSRPESVLAKIVLAVSATFVALLLGEVAVRVLIVALDRPPIVSSDPRAGWRPRSNLQHVVVSSDQGRFNLTTDSEGHRTSYDPSDPAAASAPVVLLVGDSFAFGLGVGDTETFAYLLARQLPHDRIVNLGAPGYGTDQELVQLEAYFKSQPPGTVSDIVVLVFENDFTDTLRGWDPYLGRTKPVFRIVDGRLVREDFRLSVWDTAMDTSRLIWLVNSKWAGLRSRPASAPLQTGVGVVAACLEAMRSIAQRNGVRAHVLAHRSLGRPFVEDPTWQRFLDLSRAIDITAAVRSDGAVGYDGVHWSAEGHRTAAAVVRRLAGLG